MAQTLTCAVGSTYVHGSVARICYETHLVACDEIRPPTNTRACIPFQSTTVSLMMASNCDWDPSGFFYGAAWRTPDVAQSPSVRAFV